MPSLSDIVWQRADASNFPVEQWAEWRPTDPILVDLEAACASGDIKEVTSCLERVQHANIGPKTLQPSLFDATISHHNDVASLLLDAGCPVSFGAAKRAIEAKNTTVLSMLLSHGWDINKEEAWCMPPAFHLAVRQDADSRMVAWFLENGADPNAACQIDTTPLCIAVCHAPVAIVQQLFDHLPVDTVFRGPLLHSAAGRTEPDALEVIQLVFQRCKAELNAIQFKHQVVAYECYKVGGLGTPLHSAAKKGRPEVAEFLLKEGADITLRDSCDKTALERAELSGNREVADVLRRVDNGHTAPAVAKF